MISLALRALVNLESLSGVETVGGLAKHRIAPIVVPRNGGGYVARYVPVVSGESIARGYQETLLTVSDDMGLPVGSWTKRGDFVKYAEDHYLKDDGIDPPKSTDDARRFEVDVLLKDTIADIGGFLYTGGFPVKRTSLFRVGYMVPALSDIESASLEAQYHVRYVSSQPRARKKGGEAELAQIPYQVEVGSALYCLSLVLDDDSVAVPSTRYGKMMKVKEKQLAKQQKKRTRAALRALNQLLSGFRFGARKSRFYPTVEIVSAVAAYSHQAAFQVSPGTSMEYIGRTVERAQAFLNIEKMLRGRSPELDMIFFSSEQQGPEELHQGKFSVTETGSIEELLATVTEKILK